MTALSPETRKEIHHGQSERCPGSTPGRKNLLSLAVVWSVKERQTGKEINRGYSYRLVGGGTIEQKQNKHGSEE
jgi:hypothetical protein